MIAADMVTVFGLWRAATATRTILATVRSSGGSFTRGVPR